MRKLNIFLLITLAVVLQIAIRSCISFVVGAYKTRQVVPPKQETTQEVRVEQPKFVVDPYIIQLGQEVGVSEEKLVDLKASFVESCSPIPQTLACYNGRITLNNKLKNEDRLKQRVALAHEYLHHIWWNNRGIHDSVKAQLLVVYQANKAYFDSRFVNYYNNGMKIGDEEFYNELHSFVGTEVSDSKLTPALLDHYSKYTNRNALPSYI